MERPFFIFAALLLGLQTGRGEEIVPSDGVSPGRLAATIEKAHTVLWSKFIGSEGLIHDYVGERPTHEVRPKVSSSGC